MDELQPIDLFSQEQSSEINFMDLDKIKESIYHTKDPIYISNLFKIIQELHSFLQNHKPNKETKQLLEDFADRIYNQCAYKDNSDSIDLRNSIIELCKQIEAYEIDIKPDTPTLVTLADFVPNNYTDSVTIGQETIENQSQVEVVDTRIYTHIEDYSLDLKYLIRSIREVYEQHNTLLEWVQLHYQPQYKVIIANDDIKYAKSYVEFVDSSCSGYLDAILQLGRSLDYVDREQIQLAPYKLLFDTSAQVVLNNTNADMFVTNLLSVQNSRLFRNREDTITAISESISLVNLIKLCWSLFNITYEILRLNRDGESDIYKELLKLVMEFLKSRDTSLLDRILELLQKSELEANKEAENADKLAGLVGQLDKINKGFLQNMIDRWMNMLDKFSQWLDRLNSFLNKLQIRPNYKIIQDFLDMVAGFFNILNGLLYSEKLAQLINLINNLIGALERTIEVFNKLLCSIQRMLCMIAGLIHFKDSFLNPLLQRMTNLLGQIMDGADMILGQLGVLGKITNDAIRKLVYERARMKLNSISYQAGTIVGQASDKSWGQIYKEAVQMAIDGQVSPGFLDSLTAGAKEQFNQIKEDFKAALSASNAVNCPPIALPDLYFNMPPVSLMGNMPKIKKLNINIRC